MVIKKKTIEDKITPENFWEKDLSEIEKAIGSEQRIDTFNVDTLSNLEYINGIPIYNDLVNKKLSELSEQNKQSKYISKLKLAYIEIKDYLRKYLK